MTNIEWNSDAITTMANAMSFPDYILLLWLLATCIRLQLYQFHRDLSKDLD